MQKKLKTCVLSVQHNVQHSVQHDHIHQCLHSGYDPNHHDNLILQSLNPGFDPGQDHVEQDNHDDHIKSYSSFWF